MILLNFGKCFIVCFLFFAFVWILLPVIEWSSRDEGGVCAGVWWWWWWCVDVSSPEDVRPPYNALKSSGVLLHFRFWCEPPPPPPPPCPIDVEFLLLLSRLLIVAADRRSCDDNPKRRWWFDSCVVMPIKQRLLSCKVDINECFECSWCEEEELPLWCCKLPCANAWSSSKPCCRPNRPPTKFGRRSSISLLVCCAAAAAAAAAEKFSCRLKMAGKMLNGCWLFCWCWNWCCCWCCWVAFPSLFVGLNELIEQIEFDCWPVVVDNGLVFEPLPQLPPATKFTLKSNLPTGSIAIECDWFSAKFDSSCCCWCCCCCCCCCSSWCCVAVAVKNKSAGKYSLNDASF